MIAWAYLAIKILIGWPQVCGEGYSRHLASRSFEYLHKCRNAKKLIVVCLDCIWTARLPCTKVLQNPNSSKDELPLRSITLINSCRSAAYKINALHSLFVLLSPYFRLAPNFHPTLSPSSIHQTTDRRRATIYNHTKSNAFSFKSSLSSEMQQFSVVESNELEKFLRVASISIALYEWVFFFHFSGSCGILIIVVFEPFTCSCILTLPAEWQFYRSQSSIFRLRCVCMDVRVPSLTNSIASVWLAFYLYSYGMLCPLIHATFCAHIHVAILVSRSW